MERPHPRSSLSELGEGLDVLGGCSTQAASVIAEARSNLCRIAKPWTMRSMAGRCFMLRLLTQHPDGELPRAHLQGVRFLLKRRRTRPHDGIAMTIAANSKPPQHPRP